MSDKSRKTNNNEYKLDKSESSNTTAIFIFISILVMIGLIVGVFFLMNRGSSSGTDNTAVPTTATIDESGKQILNLKAKGGYFPGLITAQAGKPSTLKIKTENTFDCSTALVIPSLNVSKSLPFSGTTSIEIPSQSAGSQIVGRCSMGMYYFTIKFV